MQLKELHEVTCGMGNQPSTPPSHGFWSSVAFHYFLYHYLKRNLLSHCRFEVISCVLGIASRAIKPTLGLVDPLHTLHMPCQVVANSGFDVLW